MKGEAEFVTKTQVHFDLWDRIMILFGRIPEITIKVIVPDMEEVPAYNAVSSVQLLKKSKSVLVQDKPRFGYVHYMKPDSQPVIAEDAQM